MALILDTGPIVAMLDATDPDHERCAALIADAHEARIVPTPVLVEVEYLVRPWAGAFAALLADIARSAITVHDLDRATTLRAGELVEQYRDLPLGFVDAAVIALTERLGERKVATLDHRHFGVVRPGHVDALDLLPGSAG